MRKTVFLSALVSLIIISTFSFACVGRTVHLGIANPANERLIAEMASLLIAERTGTTVQIDVYKNSTDLYKAVQKGDVNIFFESDSHAAEVVGKPKDTPHDQIKSEYRTKLNLIWLGIFGTTTKYGPILTKETLATYPALPKLLNKLSATLTNDTYSKLQKSVESGTPSKKIAKEFLKGKKLI